MQREGQSRPHASSKGNKSAREWGLVTNFSPGVEIPDCGGGGRGSETVKKANKRVRRDWDAAQSRSPRECGELRAWEPARADARPQHAPTPKGGRAAPGNAAPRRREGGSTDGGKRLLLPNQTRNWELAPLVGMAPSGGEEGRGKFPGADLAWR